MMALSSHELEMVRSELETRKREVAILESVVRERENEMTKLKIDRERLMQDRLSIERKLMEANNQIEQLLKAKAVVGLKLIH